MSTKAAEVIALIKLKKKERAARRKELQEKLNVPQIPLQKRVIEPDQKKGKQEVSGITEAITKESIDPAAAKLTPVTSSLPLTRDESGHTTSEVISSTPISGQLQGNEKDLHQQALETPRIDQVKDILHQDKNDEVKSVYKQEGNLTQYQEDKDLHQLGKDALIKEDDSLHQQEKDIHQQEEKDGRHQEDLLSKNTHELEEKNSHRQENKEKDLHQQSGGHDSHQQDNKQSHYEPNDDDKKEDMKGHAGHEDDTKNRSKPFISSKTPFSRITKQIEAVITDSTETSTNQVFNAATTSFFEGYGIAAGHAEDEFGGLGLIGVFEEVASIGTKSSHDQLYLLITLLIVSWFVFRR